MNTDELQFIPLDRHFARLMSRLNGEANAELEHLAQKVSAWRGAGHICLQLDIAAAETMRKCKVVGGPGDFTPLVLDDSDRLYLRRYWDYQTQLAQALRARLTGAHIIAPKLLEEGLNHWFRDERTHDQRAAAELALKKNFSVITGGPGTGKTRTVVVVLALLAEQFATEGKQPRLALAAPTGKAAARLTESIDRTAEQHELGVLFRATLPSEAMTIHRLLGAIPTSPYFRHHANNPLAVDAVVVDEASMVDLALMAKLLDAVPPHARVVLVGDKDQLASVEAGYVLGDICSAAPGTPVEHHIAELKTNFRFTARSGIHALSKFVNEGRADDALKLLRTRRHRDLFSASTPSQHGLAAALRETVVNEWRGALTAADPRTALNRIGEFQILCALRKGPHGVENLNRIAEQVLADAGLIQPDTPFYAGRSVLVLQNDYQLGLFNGDMGLLLHDPESGGALRAFFREAHGSVRKILPARLPQHETAFAITIHKAQGSEFDRVLLVLPDRDNPLMTRELIYTGLTRARSEIEVWYRDAEWRAAVNRRVERISGLRDALSGGI